MITNTYLRILDEITPSLNYIPSKEEYIAYYKKHHKTIEQQPYNESCLLELRWVFEVLKDLVKLLEQEHAIIEANNRFLLLDKEKEEKVIEWLIDYENVYEFAESFYFSHFEFEWHYEKIEGDKIVVSKELGIKIELSDFKEFIVLQETFYPLLTKYKNRFCTDELSPFDTTLQAMWEYHKIR
ncbi:MAG: hypothetical protein RLZZ529_1495 [Bacteroidota bacterium]|jgi:hypothetical protein